MSPLEFEITGVDCIYLKYPMILPADNEGPDVMCRLIRVFSTKKYAIKP